MQVLYQLSYGPNSKRRLEPSIRRVEVYTAEGPDPHE